MRFEDDFSGSGLESLNQWWVFEFEQGDEEIDEREGGYGAHPPLQSSEDQQLHPLDCFHVEDKPFIILNIRNRVLCFFHLQCQTNTGNCSELYYPRLHLRYGLGGEESIEVIDGEVGEKRVVKVGGEV